MGGEKPPSVMVPVWFRRAQGGLFSMCSSEGSARLSLLFLDALSSGAVRPGIFSPQLEQFPLQMAFSWLQQVSRLKGAKATNFA